MPLLAANAPDVHCPLLGGQTGGISGSGHEAEDGGYGRVDPGHPEVFRRVRRQPTNVVTATDPGHGGAGRHRHEQQV